MTEKIVALLPMKVNSVRVPQKNFRSFNGKPLFRWILDTLLSLEEIDQIVINTDARKKLASHGLRDSERIIIRDRHNSICGDDISMNLILSDDIQNINADIFLMTHTTNPLLSADTIRKALKTFIDSYPRQKVDSLFSVNCFQTRFYSKDGLAINHNPSLLIKTQDLEPWYEENSNLYLFTPASFMSTQSRIGKHPMLFVTPKSESFDIDGAEDWEIAHWIAMGKSQSKI